MFLLLAADRDEAAFQSYFDEMPWLALPFSQREAKQKLGQKYKVGSMCMQPEDAGKCLAQLPCKGLG